MTDDEVVDHYVAAAAAGDAELMRQILTPDAVIWHNFDDLDRDMNAETRNMGKLREVFEDFRYEEIERALIPGGAVIRQRLQGTVRASGTPVTTHVCKFLRIRDGKIARVDEYIAPVPVQA